MQRLLCALGVAAACAAVVAHSAPASAADDPCLADHTGDASVVISGLVSTAVTLTADDLRNDVAAGTLTSKTEAVHYLTGPTPTNKISTGVWLSDVMTKLAPS